MTSNGFIKSGFNSLRVFLDEFIAQLRGRVRFTVTPCFDTRLAASGSTTWEAGQEAIKIGASGLIRDTELFKTLVHEEMHLRLWRKAQRDQYRALEFLTVSDESLEEDYVERVAVRYLRSYEKRWGRFKH